MIRRRVILGVVFVVLFGLGWWVGRGGAAGDLYANLDLFVEVLQKIQDNYVDRVEPEKLVGGAVRGMLKDLDPYSQYLDSKAYTNLQSTTHGSYGGIGLVVGVRDNYPTVISPIEGSPAWNAGVRSGDVIVRIDGKTTAGMNVADAADLLRGPQGTHVTIVVHREGEEPDREVPLERRVIETRSVPYAFVGKDGVGYLRLASFSEKSAEEVRAALAELKSGGAKNLVLDLRFNPGGLLDQAVDVAEQFVQEGTLVVYTRGRARGQDNRFYAADPKPLLDLPMVVLVDGGTASASEIVAGALQDLDRALVLGTTSFGKGSVQSVYPLRGKAGALKLTTALYYTPSGRSIHKRQRPDSTASEADDEEGPPEAAPDTAARPVFHTAGGRVVYGGGGIAPDLFVRSDSLPPLTRRVETRALTFKLANRWVTSHPQWTVSQPMTPELWAEFVRLLDHDGVEHTSAELAAERPLLERSLRRELARRLGGDREAARVALEGDTVFQRAVQVLGRARAPREVFAAAGLEGPDGKARHARR